jgi:nitrogen fixation-related uncharacterized protein
MWPTVDAFTILIGIALGATALLVLCIGFAVHGDQPDDDHQM